MKRLNVVTRIHSPRFVGASLAGARPLVAALEPHSLIIIARLHEQIRPNAATLVACDCIEIGQYCIEIETLFRELICAINQQPVIIYIFKSFGRVIAVEYSAAG